MVQVCRGICDEKHNPLNKTTLNPLETDFQLDLH